MRIGQESSRHFGGFYKLLRKTDHLQARSATQLPTEAGKQLLAANGYEKVNIYGMEGMDITGRSDFKTIVPVSEEVTKKLSSCIKEDFVNHLGMTGENSKRHEIVRDYIAGLSAEERASAAWTLNQQMTREGQLLVDKVKAQNPSWRPGQPFDSKILEENAGLDIRI